MKRSSLFLTWCWAVLGLTVCVAAQDQPAAEAVDGPTEPARYTVRVGDRLAVALAPRPLPPGERKFVQPGDVLGLSYHFGMAGDEEPYRIEIGDQLKLSFRYSPELSQDYPIAVEGRYSVLSRGYTVQPDGTLALAGLDAPLKVIDRTTSEVTTMVMTAYEDLLTSPAVVVSVAPQHVKQQTLKELFQMMENRPVSFVKRPVPGDGFLSLPLVEVPAAGRSVKDIGEVLTRRYHEMGYRRTTVSAWFESISSDGAAQLDGLWAGQRGPIACEVLTGGSISLPFIPDFAAAGKTVEAIGEELTGLYASRGIQGVEATVWVEQRGTR